MTVLLEGEFDPLSIDGGLMFWSLVTFAITLAVLWKFGWRPMIDAIEGREKRILGDIERAELARAEAEASMAEHKRQLDSAAQEARRMVEEARAAGDNARAAIVTEAKEQAVQLRAQAEKEIAAARDRALADIKQHVVEVAMAVSRKMVARSADESEHRRLVDEMLAKADEASR